MAEALVCTQHRAGTEAVAGTHSPGRKTATEQDQARSLLRATLDSVPWKVTPLPLSHTPPAPPASPAWEREAWDLSKLQAHPPTPRPRLLCKLGLWQWYVCEAYVFKELLSTLQNNDISNIKIESPSAAICYYIFTRTLC